MPKFNENPIAYTLLALAFLLAVLGDALFLAHPTTHALAMSSTLYLGSFLAAMIVLSVPFFCGAAWTFAHQPS